MNTPKPQWEMKLTSIHAIVLVGLVTGSMMAAFYLGFLSGERAGFEVGQEASLAHTARIPIPDTEIDREEDGGATTGSSFGGAVAEQVYDQLAAAPRLGGQDRENEELPTLGKIESAPAKSVDGEELAQPGSAIRGTGSALARLSDIGAATESAAVGGVLGAGSEAGSARGLGKEETESTLGALDEPRLFPADGHGTVSEAKQGAAKVIDSDASRTGTDAAKGTILPATPAGAADAIKSEGVKSSPVKVASPSIASSADAKSAAIAKAESSKTGSSNAGSSRSGTSPSQPEAFKSESGKSDSGMLRNALPKGWFAQVAAPKRLSEAEAMATKLKRSGFPVLIERANVRGEEYFRVVVGPESDRVQVDRLIAQVKREGYSPFPRAVK